MILETIQSPADLKKVPSQDLAKLAAEIRRLIIDVVSEKGGHLASSLGAVEITIALHYCLDTPEDKIVWDVGHQAYAHKILTGRRERFKTLRELGGISGFPNKDESPYDPFTVGHSSTSISTALGLAAARDLAGGAEKIVAVIGDAALGGGMAFEALNYAGHLKKDIIVILNDNEHSISRTVGALSKYLNKVITNPVYNKVRTDLQGLLSRVPWFGFRVVRAARRLEEGLKNLLVPGMLFEEMGFRYFGPVDGHNIAELIDIIKRVEGLKEPRLIHVVTKKGKGYEVAERYPDKFHGTAPFVVETGEPRPTGGAKEKTFTEAFGQKMAELGAAHLRLCAITAAMPEGTGLIKFSQNFPERFFDVGIAEQNAVGFAAGLARGGLKPVVAIYSTFLQRGYDQIIHDVCLQNLPVVFAVDRAGLVGEDGATHHGIFDIAYLRHLPNITVMAPRDPEELKEMLAFALEHNGPCAMRYPRGGALSAQGLRPATAKIELGRAEILEEGRDVAIFALGSMVYPALEAAELLGSEGIGVTVVNARFVKPLDTNLIKDIIRSRVGTIVTVEEGVLDGGFGSAVMEYIEQERLKAALHRFGIESKFAPHGKRTLLLDREGLVSNSIASKIRILLTQK